MLLDFFIIGVQKGGTTALASFLRDHPNIQLSRTKEVHHFDDEQTIDWGTPCHDRLHDQFDWNVPNTLRGEATPIYIYWPNSLARLHRYNPNARLILSLRHPTFRAYSHWRMEYTRHAEEASFEVAISRTGRQRVSLAPGGVHRVYSYVERGLYSAQINRMLELFPRQQIHFLRTDRLWIDTARELARIEGFLGIAPMMAEMAQQRYVVPLDSGISDPLPLGLRQHLDSIFKDDILATSLQTGLDLSDWLSPDYIEPMKGD